MPTATATATATKPDKRRYRLLRGPHAEQFVRGNDGRGNDILGERAYNPGSIVESSIDLCKRFNVAGFPPKFALVDDATFVPERGIVFDPDSETIDEFVARVNAMKEETKPEPVNVGKDNKRRS